MGEEKKEEEKKMEDKKPEKEQEEKNKKDENKNEKKAEAEEQIQPLPLPPKEVVLKVYMHCEGCAKKVRRCLRGFDGVEDVMTDCKSQKVVVKGEKADPLKVLERLQRKSHRRVELISPIPKPPEAEEKPKHDEEEKPKPEDQNKQPNVITVVMKVHMHCEACAQEIKKRILRMKGVESAEPDLKGSQVTVKGTFEAAKLTEYVYKRTGKHAVILKQEPELEKIDEEDKPPKDGDAKAKEEKKADQDNGEEKEKKKDEGNKDENNEQSKATAAADGSEEGGTKVVEIKKSEYYFYPPRYAMEMHAYPPQIFSDENPNACTLM